MNPMGSGVKQAFTEDILGVTMRKDYIKMKSVPTIWGIPHLWVHLLDKNIPNPKSILTVVIHEHEQSGKGFKLPNMHSLGWELRTKHHSAFLFQLILEMSALFAVHLVPFPPHFCAFLLMVSLLKMLPMHSVELLSSVPKCKRLRSAL